MATSKDDILKAIEEMSVMDLVELISAIEEKFGVTAAAELQLPRQPLEMQVVMLLKKKMSSTLFFLLLVIKKFK